MPLPSVNSERNQETTRNDSPGEDDFFIQNGCRFLANLGRVDDLVRVFSSKWIANKEARFGHATSVLQDLDLAAGAARKCESKRESLLNLFLVGQWRRRLGRKRITPSLLGAECALRVRLDQIDRAISETEQLGESDDRLLVYAEVLNRAHCNGTQLTDHILAIQRLAPLCSHGIVEMACERIAAATPNVAIELARRLPLTPKSTVSTGPKAASRLRCYMRIFSELATLGHAETLKIAATLSHREERVTAWLGMCKTQIESSGSENRTFIERILSEFSQGGSYETAAAITVGRFLLMSIATRSTAWNWNGTVTWLEHVAPRMDLDELSWFLDDMISENAVPIQENILASKSTFLTDFAMWRLAVLMDRPMPDPHNVANVELSERIRASIIANPNSQRDQVRIRNVDELQTKLGYLHSLVDLANTLAPTDSAAAVRLLQAAYGETQRAADTSHVALAARILNSAIVWCNSLIPKATRACIRLLSKLDAKELHGHAKHAIGSQIAGSLEIAPNPIEKLERVWASIQTESDRLLLGKIIAPNLSYQFQLELSRTLRNGSACRNREQEHELLFAESRVILLGHLAEDIFTTNPCGAMDVVLAANAMLLDVPHGDDRINASTNLLRSAITCSPKMAAELIAALHCEEYDVVSTINDTIVELCNDSDEIVDRWAQWSIASLISADRSDITDNSNESRFGHQLHAAQKIFPVDMSLLQPRSAQWKSELPLLFQAYVSRFGSKTYFSTKLNKSARAIAEADWETFFRVIAEATVADATTHTLDLQDLARSLLTSCKRPDELISDIHELRAKKRAAFPYEREEEPLSAWCIALLAVQDPQECVRALCQVPLGSKASFVMRLQHLTPSRPWQIAELTDLSELLIDSSAFDSSLTSVATFLAWHKREFVLEAKILQPLATLAVEKCSAPSQSEIAFLFWGEQHQSVVDLIRAALKGTLYSGHGRAFCKLAHRVLTAHNVDEGGPSRDLKDWLRAMLSPSISPDTLASLGQGLAGPVADPDGTKESLKYLSECAGIQHQNDVEQWLVFLGEIQETRHEDVESAKRRILERANEVGLLVSLETINLLTDPEDRVKVLLTVAKSQEHPSNSDALKLVRHLISVETTRDSRAVMLEQLGTSLLAGGVAEGFDELSIALALRNREVQGIAFILALMSYAQECIVHGGAASKRFAEEIYDTAKSYRYGEIPGAPPITGPALLCAAFAYWRHDKRRFAEILEEATSNYSDSLEANGSMLGSTMYSIHQRIWESLGEGVADSFENDLIEVLLAKPRDTLADALARVFLTSGPNELPLAQCHVWKRAIEPSCTRFVELILPHCSRETALLLHRSLAISYVNHDAETAKRHIGCAVELLTDPEVAMPVESNVEKDIWTTYARLNGLDGCKRALFELQSRSDRDSINLEGLLTCVAETIAEPGAFLSELFERTYAIETDAR